MCVCTCLCVAYIPPPPLTSFFPVFVSCVLRYASDTEAWQQLAELYLQAQKSALLHSVCVCVCVWEGGTDCEFVGESVCALCSSLH